MRSTFFVTDACAGCGACIKTGPEKAIHPSGCAECAEVCPVSACIELLLEEE
jgi:NAD-dependent dihydropyrimidine dehydrogenase PreA subunit